MVNKHCTYKVGWDGLEILNMMMLLIGSIFANVLYRATFWHMVPPKVDVLGRVVLKVNPQSSRGLMLGWWSLTKPAENNISFIAFSQCFDNVGWVTGRASGLLNWVLVCWWWRFDWIFAHLTAPVVTTASIILSSNIIQNVSIVVPAVLQNGY